MSDIIDAAHGEMVKVMDNFYSVIHAAYAQAYGDYPFVKWASAENNQSLLSLKSVVGTNHIHLTYEQRNNKLLVFATMDNLRKGAASQAIENFNLLNNMPITAGL